MAGPRHRPGTFGPGCRPSRVPDRADRGSDGADGRSQDRSGVCDPVSEPTVGSVPRSPSRHGDSALSSVRLPASSRQGRARASFMRARLTEMNERFAV
jgi:hypothetical protein